jgi:hypothetical protein
MRISVFALTAWLVAMAAAAPAPARDPWEGRPIYGADLLSKAERKAYWSEFLALETFEEQEAYWLAHVAKMQRLAIERGVSLPDPPEKSPAPGEEKLVYSREPYFADILTPEERDAYHTEIDAIKDRSERRAFVRNHIAKMQARGLERGLSPPSTADFAYAYEPLDEAGQAAPAPAADPERADGTAPEGGDGAVLDVEFDADFGDSEDEAP